VTDISLSEQTLEIVMRGGRARWRIENETFNTLSRHFEHRCIYHLAHLIDQLQGLSCKIFQQAQKGKTTFGSNFMHCFLVSVFPIG